MTFRCQDIVDDEFLPAISLYEQFDERRLHDCAHRPCSCVEEILHLQTLRIDQTSVSVQRQERLYLKQESNRFHDGHHPDQESVRTDRRTIGLFFQQLYRVSPISILHFLQPDEFHLGGRQHAVSATVANAV